MRKKIIMVIAQEGFRDEELLEPKDFFEKNGFEVIVASPKGGICRGMIDAVVRANIKIEEVVLDKKTVAVLVVGGANSPSLMDVPSLGDILVESKEKGLIIGAICLAPMVVASFGIFDNIHATVFKTSDSLQMFKDHNVHFLDEDVLVEEPFVTANGPRASLEFAKSVVLLL